MTKLILIWIMAAVCEPYLKVTWLNQMGFLFEPNLGSLYWYPVLRLHRRIFVTIKRKSGVKYICISPLMYLYLSHSNRNLVWNINCTRLPVSELITSRNLSLFWNCALSTSHCSAIPAPTVNWYFSMQAEWKLTWMSNTQTMQRDLPP